MVVDVVRLSLQGQLPGGEVWSVNPVFQILNSAQTPTATQMLTIAQGVNALTISAGITAVMSTSTSITGCRAEARQYSGTLVALGEAVRGAPVVGTGGVPHSFQNAIVCSLRSAFPGASGRGRLYFPATGVPTQATNLRPSSSVVNSFLLGTKALLTAMQGVVQPVLGNNTLVVWSRTGNISHAITELRAGDVLDVQRRRRDQEIENYSTTPWP